MPRRVITTTPPRRTLTLTLTFFFVMKPYIVLILWSRKKGDVTLWNIRLSLVYWSTATYKLHRKGLFRFWLYDYFIFDCLNFMHSKVCPLLLKRLSWKIKRLNALEKQVSMKRFKRIWLRLAISLGHFLIVFNFLFPDIRFWGYSIQSQAYKDWQVGFSNNNMKEVE